jgi:hypothetical protein
MIELGAGSGSTDVYAYTSTASFPGTGTAAVLYLATDSGKIFRWDSSGVYVEVGPVGGSFAWASVPTNSGSSGTVGNVAYDSTYFYVRNASLWKRVALSAWGGDSLLSSVALLLHFEGSNGSTTFTDSSTAADGHTYGNASISTSQAKWGAASAFFDGSGDYLIGPSVNLSTNNLCVEFWLRVSGYSLPGYALFDSLTFGGVGERTNAFVLILNGSGYLNNLPQRSVYCHEQHCVSFKPMGACGGGPRQRHGQDLSGRVQRVIRDPRRVAVVWRHRDRRYQRRRRHQLQPRWLHGRLPFNERQLPRLSGSTITVPTAAFLDY